MKCSSCGKEAGDGAFCPSCGASLTGAAPKPDAPDEGPGPAERAMLRLKPTGANEPERDLWSGGYSPKAMIGHWVACGAFTIGAVVVASMVNTNLKWTIALGLIALAWASQGLLLMYRKLSIHYKLTSQKFIHEIGLLSRETNRMDVIDMDDITFRQSLFERFMGVGTMRIISSDRTDPDMQLPGIDKIAEVAGIFDDARRAERRRRGLHIESV